MCGGGLRHRRLARTACSGIFQAKPQPAVFWTKEDPAWAMACTSMELRASCRRGRRASQYSAAVYRLMAAPRRRWDHPGR